MNKHTFIRFALLGSFFSFVASVQASPQFVTTINTALGNNASVSCNACHNGATTTATATLPMANTFRAARSANDYTLIATSDSDSDGYINKYEVNGSAVEFNDAAVSPFTKATAANNDANVKALADTAAASSTFADPNGLAGTGKEILGGIKVTLNQADTIYFKAGGVSSTDTIYTVDAAGVGTQVAAADWTATADGGLQIKALPAGATTADYVVVHPVPTTTTPTLAHGTASVTGCISSGVSAFALIALSMLGLGFLARRKS